MNKISIVIVNLNCLQDTKELVDDLNRQTYPNFEVFLHDQASTEPGTAEFLEQVASLPNYTVIQTGENRPLNHIWNDFARNSTGKYMAVLNNDIRVTANYLEDSVNVLEMDNRVGIAIHATNNRRYTTATTPTRHILETTEIKQGWEFTLNRNDWVPIPHLLKFYCGDDFIFDAVRKSGKKVGVITSSPVLHKLSKTRKNMNKEDSDKIRAQALSDIATYKSLGFKHVWNNITKHSRLEPEFTTMVEINTEVNLCKFPEYQKRLNEHLNECRNIDGIILDVGINDLDTFNVLLDSAVKTDKKLIGVDSSDHTTGAVVSKREAKKSYTKLAATSKDKDRYARVSIMQTGLTNSIDSLDTSISFAFIGVFSAQKIQSILPNIWNNMQSGGTIFFPYYNYNSCPVSVMHVIDEFFKDKQSRILRSRMQTHRGVRDTYLVVKCYPEPLPVPKRTKPLVVASVLKTGGVYDETYVNRLASAVSRHIKCKYEFVCLTDVDGSKIDTSLVDRVIPLEYGFKGWWSKLELFRPELFNDVQVLYLDLDTLITDDITDFANYGGEFMGLRDMNTLVTLASGILSWNASNAHHIFYKFVRKLLSNEIAIRQFNDGDQQAIGELMEMDADWVQDLFPQKMCAFKYQCYDSVSRKMFIPDGCSIICFHGKPKMADLVSDPVIIEHWK